MSTTRPAAVAGTFYPDSPIELKRTLSDLIEHAHARELNQAPKALIVPHAGYIYSGPIAASAYAQIAKLRGRIRKVVLLGPTHRVAVRGLALPDADRFATPLGAVSLDQDAMRSLANLPQVSRSAVAHQFEHSLEVQLPFLQQVLGDFQLLPLAVGDATGQEVAEVLERVWGGDETLIVISSDLSHFLPDALARQIDRKTAEAIAAMDPHLNHEQACGATPVNGLLLAARKHGLRAVELDIRNSSETAGDPERVVGYAAFAFVPEQNPATDEDEKGDTLLKLARAEIGQHLGHALPVPPPSDWLRQPGASFVTLTKMGDLRGCIGSLEPHRPLGDDVRANALAAAFRDPRFMPLAREEFNDIRVEVSLLSPTESLSVSSEDEALSALRPGIDGLIFEYDHHRSTFLPQVWEQLPEPLEFLAHLKRKAGLPLDFWAADVRLSRYTVSKWKEQGGRP
ncbi:MAG: AmmeMemoRadiSam system protein B [Thiobacillaceae bacterium]|nr:AmmeMemoRadiSam system protein B [Thiobacillaceae bacterium]